MQDGWAWMRSHKRRCAALAVGGMVLGYGVTYGLVASADSIASDVAVLQDGREVGFARWGSETPRVRIVLVHGAPADASCWSSVRVLSDRMPDAEWIAVDRLGYGRSSPECETRLAEHAKSLSEFLDDAPIGGVILVGHSYGGPVVLRAAAEYPRKMRGIVLVAGACDAYMNDAQWFRKGVDALGMAVPPAWSHANRELLALTDENRAMEAMLNRVTCAVSIVHGTWDPVCPFEGTRGYLASRLTSASEVRVLEQPRALHNLHLTHAEDIVREIQRLLETGERAPGG